MTAGISIILKFKKSKPVLKWNVLGFKHSPHPLSWFVHVPGVCSAAGVAIGTHLAIIGLSLLIVNVVNNAG